MHKRKVIGGVHVNIALADEFKLSETYLLSSQTINRKLPISCKNRSGKYSFQPLLIFFRLVFGKKNVYWTIFIIKTVCKNFAAVMDLVSLIFYQIEKTQIRQFLQKLVELGTALISKYHFNLESQLAPVCIFELITLVLGSWLEVMEVKGVGTCTLFNKHTFIRCTVLNLSKLKKITPTAPNSFRVFFNI